MLRRARAHSRSKQEQIEPRKLQKSASYWRQEREAVVSHMKWTAAGRQYELAYPERSFERDIGRLRERLIRRQEGMDQPAEGRLVELTDDPAKVWRYQSGT